MFEPEFVQKWEHVGHYFHSCHESFHLESSFIYESNRRATFQLTLHVVKLLLAQNIAVVKAAMLNVTAIHSELQ